jgi:hypothetical protein
MQYTYAWSTKTVFYRKFTANSTLLLKNKIPEFRTQLTHNGLYPYVLEGGAGGAGEDAGDSDPHVQGQGGRVQSNPSPTPGAYLARLNIEMYSMVGAP